MTLKTQMASDVADVFLNTGEFAETVSYTPDGGSATDISAVVVRDPVDVQESPNGLEYQLWATVCADVADVASPATGDVYAFPKIGGGTAVNWNAAGLPEVHGDGMVKVRVFRREFVERTAAGHRQTR